LAKADPKLKKKKTITTAPQSFFIIFSRLADISLKNSSLSKRYHQQAGKVNGLLGILGRHPEIIAL
jgi:hypothetical protein